MTTSSLRPPTAEGRTVKSHTEYRINGEQAAVVRAIYKMYVDGHGTGTVAKTLNGDPRHLDKNRKYFEGAVPVSTAQGHGVVGPVVGTGNPHQSPVHRQGPLRQAPQNLSRRDQGAASNKRNMTSSTRRDFAHRTGPICWDAAQARFAAAAKTYLRDTGGKLWGRPGMGRESKYLLTGMGRCTVCGANIQVIGGKSGVPGKRRSVYYYGCSYHHNRGPTVCANDHNERMETMDDAVLEAIEKQILTPDALAYTLEKALELAQAHRAQEPGLVRRLEGELKKVSRELDGLIALVVKGKAPARVVAEIETRESRIKELEAEIAQVTGPADELDVPRLKKALRDRLSRFKDLIYSDIPLARQGLRKLLGGEPMRISPVTRNGRRTLAFEGVVPVGMLLGDGYLEVASPRGFEPLLPP